MPNGQMTREQLEAMSIPQLQTLQKQLRGQRTGDVFRGAAVGGLQGLAGQKITGLTKPTPTAQEQLAQIRIDQELEKERVRLGRGGITQPSVGAPLEVPPIEPTGVPPVEVPTELPPEGGAEIKIKPYITVNKWKTDDFGSYQVPVSEVNPKYVNELELKEFRTKEEEKILNQGRGEKAKQLGNFETVAGILQQTTASWKAAASEKVGMPQIPGAEGFIAKATAPVVGALGTKGFPFTKAYVGQRIETAMMLSKIITGGARIIKSVINNLMKTLPQDTGLTADMEALIEQSYLNSYTRSIGRTLTPEERKEAIARAKDITQNTPAMNDPQYDLPVTEPLPIRTIEVDGVLYDVPVEDFVDFVNDQTDDAIMYDRTGR